MEDQPEKNKAEEPGVDYSKWKITVFESFEEAEEADNAYYRGLTPEQRFEHFYKLMARFFTFKGTLKGEKIVIDNK